MFRVLHTANFHHALELLPEDVLNSQDKGVEEDFLLLSGELEEVPPLLHENDHDFHQSEKRA